MQPKIIIISKKIIIAAMLFLMLSGLIRLTEVMAVRQWKQEMFKPGLAGKTVIIDPGHGGADPGATLDGVKESELNMAIAVALQKELTKNGVKVRLTRQGDNGLVPMKKMTYSERWVILEKRKKFAQDHKGHILVSIHANSNKDPRASGGMVFYSDQLSRTLAESIQKQLNTLGMRRRQVERGNFTIITGNQMTSVLVETGFITNEKDLLLLTEKKEAFSRVIFNGLREYTENLKPIVSTTEGQK